MGKVIDGRRYEFDSTFISKRKADQRARSIRDVGDYDRVVKESSDYTVYRRNRR